MAMGIDLYFTPGSAPLRSVYLEGYGALYILNANFPLMPPAKAESAPEKGAEKSSWEEARRELYGEEPGGRAFGAPGEPYDEDKVKQLKDELLESLKNAANVRGLKADDTITVTVCGGANSGPVKMRPMVRRGSSGTTVDVQTHVLAFNRSGPAGRNTMLTIRVKKADADAFAKEKLSLDEFRKRAKIAVYTGSAESGGGMGGVGSFPR
jgi:hypothetical protein